MLSVAMTLNTVSPYLAMAEEPAADIPAQETVEETLDETVNEEIVADEEVVENPEVTAEGQEQPTDAPTTDALIVDEDEEVAVDQQFLQDPVQNDDVDVIAAEALCDELKEIVDKLPDPATLGSTPKDKAEVYNNYTNVINEANAKYAEVKASEKAAAMWGTNDKYASEKRNLDRLIEYQLFEVSECATEGTEFAVKVGSLYSGYSNKVAQGASDDEVKSYLDNPPSLDNLQSLESTLTGYDTETTGKGSLIAYFVDNNEHNENARAQLKEMRAALDKINSKQAVDDTIDDTLGDLGVDATVQDKNNDGRITPDEITSNDLDDQGKQQLADILNKLKDDISNATDTNGNGSVQDEVDALVEKAKQDIDNIKTKYEKDSEAYMNNLNSQKSNVFDKAVNNANNAQSSSDVKTIQDDLQNRYNQLMSDYNNLSDKAKALADQAGAQEKLKGCKDALDAVKGIYEKKLFGEQKTAELKKFKEDIDAMIKDVQDRDEKLVKDGHEQKGPYDDAEQSDLDTIRNRAVEDLTALKTSAEGAIQNVSAEAGISQVKSILDGIKSNASTIKNRALEDFEKVKTIARKKADALEQKIAALGNSPTAIPRDQADTVKNLINEYKDLDSFLSNDRYRKYTGNKNPGKNMIESDIINSDTGETYKQRLDSCQAQIDRMAQEDANALEAEVNKLSAPENATLANEGAVNAARRSYDSLTKEAKAKVKPEVLQKIKDLEAKMALEHYEQKLQRQLDRFVEDKLAKTTYDKQGKTQVNSAYKDGLKDIDNATSYSGADNALSRAIARINAVKTVAQKMKEKGVQYNFNRMRFRTTKQTKGTIYLRWVGVDDIAGFQVYGSKVGEPMKMLRQYDYRARSAKFSRLKKGTQYQYRIYAFKVVDGEIIKVYGSPIIYANTKGGKYGNIKSVKIKKVGKKSGGNKKTVKVKLKKGKTAKIKAKTKKSGSKIKKHYGIKYESTNPSIVKVSSSGKMTAVGRGTAYVRVYSQSGAYRTVKVTVK